MDITDLILFQHHEQRRQFALLDELADEPRALAAVWNRLAVLLEVHAAAEERYFYPRVLELGHGAGGADSAEDETEDAIGDHNDIRDAVADSRTHEVGSHEWYEAVGRARTENSDHLAEEEDEGLPNFRKNAPRELRAELAQQWIAFYAAHPGGQGVDGSDKDPQQYVEQHS